MKRKLCCTAVLLLAMVMLFSIAMAENASGAGVANRSIQITSDHLTVKTGGKITLKATAERLSDDAPKKTAFRWSSSDESIAKVASNGTVTGVNAGEALITCVAEDDAAIAASVTVSVYQPVKSLKVEPSKITLKTGGDEALASASISPIITPEDATYAGVIYSSDHPNVATVNDEGLVQAVSAGKTKIIITSAEPGSKLKATCDVTVEALVASISAPEEISLGKGKSYAIKPEISPAGAANKKLIYESLNPEIASVSASGTVKAEGYGTAVIRISAADGGPAGTTMIVSIGCPIDQKTFPDNQLRALIAETQDENHDGVLTPDELAKVTELNISGLGIGKLTGIEVFSNLSTLDCSNNNLSELKIPENSKLEKLNCGSNRIKTLDVSKAIYLRELDCSYQATDDADDLQKYDAAHTLKKLDISKNVNLTVLDCSDNALTELDLSQNTALVKLVCYYNRLKTLDVSNLEMLQELDCSDQEVLVNITYSHGFWSADPQYTLKELKLGTISSLTKLECRGSLLEGELHLGNLHNLQSLNLSYCKKITAVDISGCTELEELHLIDLGLSKIDLTHNPHLKVLELEYEHAGDMPSSRTVDLSANTELRELRLEFLYGSLDLRAQEMLESVMLRNCRFARIYVEHNENLVKWDVSDSKTGYVDYSLFPNLTYLQVTYSNNWIMDVTQNPKLEYLNIGKSYVHDIDLSQNPMLKELWCYYNPIMSLDISHNTQLEILGCFDNATYFGEPYGLTTLDLSQNAQLRQLSIRGNRLAELDISNCPYLVELVQSETRKYSSANECFLSAAQYGIIGDNAELRYDVFTKIIMNDYTFDPVAEGIADARQESPAGYGQMDAEVIATVRLEDIDTTVTQNSQGHITLAMPIDVYAHDLGGVVYIVSPDGMEKEQISLYYSNIEKTLIGDAVKYKDGWIQDVWVYIYTYASPDEIDKMIRTDINFRLDQEGNVLELNRNEHDTDAV